MLLVHHKSISKQKITIFNIIIISILIFAIKTQSQCSVSPLPITLPVVSNNDNLTIDLSSYFSGNNLSFSITPPNRQIYVKQSLQKLYNFSSFHIGNILSVDGWQIVERRKKIDNFNASILVRSQRGQYTLYYGNIQTWQTGYDKKILGVESQIGNCGYHVMDSQGNYAVHCQTNPKHQQQQQYKQMQLIFGNVKNNTSIYKRFPLLTTQKHNIKLILLSNNLLIRAHIVPDLVRQNFNQQLPINCYFQVWDMIDYQIMGVYDRTFFNLYKLSIMDISQGGIPLIGGQGTKQLFILNYNTGIYKLILNKQRVFIIQGFQQAQYFEKLSIFKERTILSRKNAIVQINQLVQGSKVTKYQTIVNSQILAVQGNQDYIIVKTINQVVIFKKGVISPFYLLPLKSPFTQIMLFSNVMMVFQNDATQITISPYTFHPHNLHIEMLSSSVNITIIALSKVSRSQTKCNASTQLKVFPNYDQQIIFKNIYNTDLNEVVYLNRPGNTQLNLQRYASGSNLTYDLISLDQKLDFSYKFNKINATQVTIDINIAKTGLFINRVNSQSNVIRIQFEDLSVFYLKCGIPDTVNISKSQKKVQCKRMYFQNINQSPTILKYITFISSNPLFPSLLYQTMNIFRNEIIIRKFILQPQKVQAQVLCTIKYPLLDSNINDITDVDIYLKKNQDLGIFVLLSKRKQILYYQYSQKNLNQCQLKKIIQASNIKHSNQNSRAQLFYPQKIQIIRQQSYTEEIKTHSIYTVKILVKQFNQLYVLTVDINQLDDMNIQNSQLRVQKSSSIILKDVSMSGAYQMNVRYPNILVLQTNQMNVNQILRVYKIEQQNNIKFSHDLPTYGQKLNGFYSKVPSTSLVTVGMASLLGQQKVAIYDLASLTSFYSYFGEDSELQQDSIKFSQNSFKQNLKLKQITAILRVPHIQAPILTNFPIKLPQTGILKSYIIHSHPFLQLSLQSSTHSLQSQQFYIRVMNTNDSLRHLVDLKIANYPDNISYGSKYPYNSKNYQIQDFVTIHTNRWFKGNVIKYDFSCVDCVPRLFGAEPLIKVYDKIYKRKSIPAYNGKNSILVNGLSYVLKGNNLIYVINLQTTNVQKSYVIPTSSQCSHLQMSDSFFLKNELLLVLCGRQLYGLSLVSQSNKNNVVINYLLPTYGVNLYFHKSVAIVQGLDGIYLISIPNDLNVRILDFIDISQLGQICTIDFLKVDHQNITAYHQYTSIFTLCEQGFWLIKFRIQKGIIITYTQKQKVSIDKVLSSINLNIPSNSRFINTVITNFTSSFDNTTLQCQILTIMDRFHSFQWKMRIKNSFADNLELIGILHRYGNYIITGKVSFLDDYVVLEMIKDQDDYIYGLYDKKDFSTANQNMTKSDQQNKKKISNYDNSLRYQSFSLKQNQQNQKQNKQNELKIDDVKNYYIIQSASFHNKSSFKLVSFKNAAQSLQNKQQFSSLKNSFYTNHQLVSISYSQNQLSIYQITNAIRLNITNSSQILTQNLLIIPSTNYNAKTVSIKLNGINPFVFEWWLILLIVVFSIGLLIGLCVGGVYLYRYIQRKRKLIPLLTDYLDTKEGQFQSHNQQEENNIAKQIQQIRNRKSQSSRSKSQASNSSQNSDSNSSDQNKKNKGKNKDKNSKNSKNKKSSSSQSNEQQLSDDQNLGRINPSIRGSI